MKNNLVYAAKRLRYIIGMAEIGTPENPEIIEPGQRPPPRRDAGAPSAPPPTSMQGPRLSWQLFRVLFMVSFPILSFDMVYAWIVHAAVNYGGLLPWFGLLVLAPLALILNLVLVAANVLLWPVILLALSGRATNNPLNDQRFARFKIINVRR